ncbi:MAG: hypothetical protein RL755_761 [Pseudomonadota bacterium]
MNKRFLAILQSKNWLLLFINEPFNKWEVA